MAKKSFVFSPARNIKMDFAKVTEPIFYVTPDPARAIGLEKVLSNFHIVCLDDNQLVDLLAQRGVKVFSLEKKIGKDNQLLRTTGSVLESPHVWEYIEQNSQGEQPNVLFFKPSKKIEAIAYSKKYRLLGNTAELNNLYEDKISFHKLCLSWDLPVVNGEIGLLENCSYDDLGKSYGQRLVIQFGHGWAGNTTFFVENEGDFKDLEAKFPKREARITRFVQGETYLVNACVTKEAILVSPPAIQITAPEGFTANLGGTCGRQWPAELSDKAEKQITQYTQIVGDKMRNQGYKGYFGLDFLLEEGTDELFLSECNARLTASVPIYTKMELKSGKTPLLFYHLLEFLENYHQVESYEKEEVTGAELIIRNSQPRQMKVSGELAPGIYSYGQELSFIKDGYSFEDIENPEEFFLLAAGQGRTIAPENEIARINTREKILDEEGKIKDWARQALLKAKEKLFI